MGMDLYFEKVERTVLNDFESFYPLFNWMNCYLGNVHNCGSRLIGKSVILDLYEDLKTLNEKNCEEIFPDHQTENYDESYWEEVVALKEWLEDIIEHFNFEQSDLQFTAWW